MGSHGWERKGFLPYFSLIYLMTVLGRAGHESDSLEQSRPKFPFSGGDDEQYGFFWASQVALVVKNPPANVGDIRDAGSIPGSG